MAGGTNSPGISRRPWERPVQGILARSRGVVPIRPVQQLAPGEPGVEPPERPGVGAAGVRADGGLDQPARGLSRSADRGLFGVGPGGPIIHVNGNYR